MSEHSQPKKAEDEELHRQLQQASVTDVERLRVLERLLTALTKEVLLLQKKQGDAAAAPAPAPTAPGAVGIAPGAAGGSIAAEARAAAEAEAEAATGYGGVGIRERVTVHCPPSELANPEGWPGALASPGLVPFLNYRCDRGSQRGGAPPLPLSLVDATLGAIKAAFQYVGEHAAPPAAHECKAAVKLLTMGNSFPDELQRRTALIKVLDPYLLPNRLHAAAVPGTTCNTDGHITTNFFPIYIQGVKNEIGTSGDPYFQSQRHYQLFLEQQQACPTMLGQPCPCLLLELVGPHLRVSAMASVEDFQVLCEPLTPYMHLFNMMSSDIMHMQQLGRLMRSLKWAVHRLDALYQQWELQHETPQERPAKQPRQGTAAVGGSTADGSAAAAGGSASAGARRDPALLLPYPLRQGFRGPSGVEGTLPEMPRPLSRPVLMYGCTLAAAPTRRLVVKYVCCGMYGSEVHKAWASAGLAPTLISCQPLPGGIIMVTMDDLHAADGWVLFAALPQDQRQRWAGTVQRALRRGHEVEVLTGQRAVHCDMRPANVMIRLPQPSQRGAGGQEAGGSGASGREASSSLGGEHAGDAGAGAREAEAGSCSAAMSSTAQGYVAQSSEPEVRFVDFDWAAVEDKAVLPPFASGRCGKAAGDRVTQKYDVDAWLETCFTDGFGS